MDQSKWPERLIKVTNLLLDAKNSRIPRSSPDPSQRDLIAELVRHDKVYQLARKIVRAGWYRMESLVGIEQAPSQRIIIYEGNRRLAALKVLINPELAPPEYLRKFQRLSRRADVASFKKVKVLIAPDRYLAAPMIADKHTREQTERWSRVMQANFFRTLMSEEGATVKDLQEKFGVPPFEAAAFLRRSTIYAVACGLDLPADVASVVRNPRRFKSSTLDRLLDNPKVTEFLGITFDTKKGLRGHVPADQFTNALSKIVTDIAVGSKNGGIDSRTVNTAEQQNAYLKKIGAWRPDSSKRGSFTEKDLLAEAEAAVANVPSVGPAIKGRNRTSSSIIPTGWKCQLQNDRIRDVFDELRLLRPVAKYRNTVAVMLRVLLELALAHHFNKTKKMAKLVKQLPPGQSGHAPTLRSMLGYVISEDNILDPHASAALDKLLKGQHTAISLETMNKFVHNTYTTPIVPELQSIWRALEPLFEVILVEPKKQDGP
jgi:hypothetical protein